MSGRVAAHDVVDDSLGKRLIESPAKDEPEVDRADQQLGGDLGIGVRAQLAAFDPAGDQAGDFVPPGLNDRGPKRISQQRVACNLRQQGPNDGPEFGLGQGPHRIHHRREHLLARVAGLFDGDVRSSEIRQQRLGQLFLDRQRR